MREKRKRCFIYDSDGSDGEKSINENMSDEEQENNNDRLTSTSGIVRESNISLPFLVDLKAQRSAVNHTSSCSEFNPLTPLPPIIRSGKTIPDAFEVVFNNIRSSERHRKVVRLPPICLQRKTTHKQALTAEMLEQKLLAAEENRKKQLTKKCKKKSSAKRRRESEAMYEAMRLQKLVQHENRQITAERNRDLMRQQMKMKLWMQEEKRKRAREKKLQSSTDYNGLMEFSSRDD